jgi:hypothetical protein
MHLHKSELRHISLSEIPGTKSVKWIWNKPTPTCKVFYQISISKKKLLLVVTFDLTVKRCVITDAQESTSIGSTSCGRLSNSVFWLFLHSTPILYRLLIWFFLFFLMKHRQRAF